MRRIADTLIGWGPGGLLFLAALDSAGIPIPAAVDAMLMLLSAHSPTQAAYCAFLALVGSLAGSMFLFWVARRGGEAYLARHTISAKGKKFRKWFQHYGLLTVFISAISPIPLPMKLFVICSGALGIKPLYFFATILAARGPRYAALAYLGSELGHDAGTFLKGHLWHIGGALVGLFLVLFMAVKLMDARRARIDALTGPVGS